MRNTSFQNVLRPAATRANNAQQNHEAAGHGQERCPADGDVDMTADRANSGSTNRMAPDQRRELQDRFRMTKPATRIRQLLGADPSTAVSRVLEVLDRPSAEGRCLNPECANICRWTGTEKGRPPRFCTDTCRMAFAKQRARLLDELEAYQDLAKSAPVTWTQRNELRRRVQSVEMQLDRYPSFG